MSAIEPFAHLKLDTGNDDDGQFISFWRFSCLNGCIICQKPKPIDLTNNDVPMDELFASEWFLVSREDDLRALCNDVNQKFQHNFACRVYDALKKNHDYSVVEFHQDLANFEKLSRAAPCEFKLKEKRNSLIKVFYFTWIFLKF